MNVTYRKLSELTKLQNNPRRIEKEDMERLKSSVVMDDYSVVTLWLKPKHWYFKENGYQMASIQLVASYLRIKQLQVEIP